MMRVSSFFSFFPVPVLRGAVRPAVAAGLAVALVGLGPRPAGAEPVDLELVLAVDISGSIDHQEARLQREGYLAAITDPRVLHAIQSGYHRRIALAYVEWAGRHFQETLVDWRIVEDARSARAFAAALAEAPIQTQRRTSISTAIDYAAAMFDDNGFEGARRVIDISGDGINNSGRLITEARDEAVAKGITINGLAIINGRPGPSGWPQPEGLDRYYDTFVIGGHGAFMVVADTFRDFARAVRQKMLREIAGDPGARARAAVGG